ncbi:MAG: hypothetical protein BMS9Abin23_0296 [Thermodesulfobacteriota bacterium]|nr:MAG: hypothetical protein BMS9Abin23_0296 [Thermodesulfobacteriota bacterium]
MKKILIFITVALFLLTATPSIAAQAQVDDVRISLEPDFSVSFTVKNAFSENIEEAIKSGVPTSFNFIVELTRSRRLWFDQEVGRWEFRHTVKYDTLKEEYKVILDEKGFVPVRTKDFGEMKSIMSSADAVTLEPMRRLAPGYNYQLRIMAELHTVRLPFRLDYLLFFLKLWNVETDWYVYEFSL